LMHEMRRWRRYYSPTAAGGGGGGGRKMGWATSHF